MKFESKFERRILEPQGPYVPGCADVMVGESKEGLFVRFYYPSSLDKSKDHSSQWISWLPHRKYLDGFAYVLGLWRFLFHLLYDLVAGDKKVPVASNSPITKQIDRIPVIVFSHGMGGSRFLYTGVCCELAAHGYLVAAVEHRDGSAGTTWWYADKQRTEKRWFRYQRIPVGSDKHKRARSEQVEKRAEEAARVLQLLRDIDRGESMENLLGDDFPLDQLKGRLDFSSPIMMGQSFGGATTLLTMAKTPEFKMGIIMDPWMFPLRYHDDIHEKVDQPLLCINMQTFQIPPNLRALHKFTAREKPAVRSNYTIRHTTHENQSDTVHLIGYWLDFLMKKLDPVIATRINNALILRFLKDHAGLRIDHSFDQFLKEQDHNIVNDITVEGVINKVKKIPGKTAII